MSRDRRRARAACVDTPRDARCRRIPWYLYHGNTGQQRRARCRSLRNRCAAAADSPASVTDLVFYATHELAADGVDARLFKHYSAMLRRPKTPSSPGCGCCCITSAMAWTTCASSTARARRWAAACAAGASGRCGARWPRWRAGRTASAAYATILGSQGENYRRYFYFHASLLLWNMTFGYAYPRVKYYWRVEPDVLFNSRLNRLVELAAADDADLLLGNKYNSHLDRPDWPHFALNRHVLGTLPEKGGSSRSSRSRASRAASSTRWPAVDGGRIGVRARLRR